MSGAPLPPPHPQHRMSAFVCPECGERYAPGHPTGDYFFCSGGKNGPAHATVKMERAELEKDIVAEPITAFRAWRLLPGEAYPAGSLEYRLWAWGKTWEWPKKSAREGIEAICLARPIITHQVPNHRCSCGFWAFDSEKTLAERILGVARGGKSLYAWGEVKIWGRIIEGSRAGRFGYRAQYAKVEKIIIVNRTTFSPLSAKTLAKKIESFYQIQVSIGKDPREMSHEEKYLAALQRVQKRVRFE